MDKLIPVVGTMALLGSALVGGIFFAFSSFVMKALANVPSAEGIGAMQSINVVVINPSFLGAFFGTAVLSLVAGGLALANWGSPSASFFLGGALFLPRGHHPRHHARERSLERPVGRRGRHRSRRP